MIPEIDQTSFAARLVEDDVLVVDVRESREYRPGHVPGAKNMPLSLLPALLPEVPKDRPVYVICQSGGRSAQATALMRAVGIDATTVAGGTGAWIEAGRPVDTAA
jgi:rhodanese-related sulfurtransferase